ncbi:MAG: glycosyltransferase, partial [Bdellovibrionota bacterium]
MERKKDRTPCDGVLFRGRPGDEVASKGKAVSVSTIIPTLNEAENIGVLLDSLFACGAGEVIVVDGGSADRTQEIAKEK